MLFPSIHPTPRSEATLDCQESPPQALDTGKGARQVQRVFLHGLRGFGQAAVGIGPKASQEDPRLHEHGQEFGIHLTENAPRFGAARLVHVAMTLPQLEEQLALPDASGKNELVLPQARSLDADRLEAPLQKGGHSGCPLVLP